MKHAPRLHRAGFTSVAIAASCLPALAFADDDAELKPGYTPRPLHWAQPAGGHPGITNFYKVDDALYRGAQPTDDGFGELRKLGIRTVVDVRSRDHSDGDPAGNGIEEIDIPCRAWTLSNAHTAAFLKTMADPGRYPVYLHCRRGADRTGTLVAVYRIAVQGWSKSAAIEEMLEGGYHFADDVLMHLAEYIWNLDVDRVCAEAGITPAPPRGIEPVSPDWTTRFSALLRDDGNGGERVRRGWKSRFAGMVFGLIGSHEKAPVLEP